MCVKCHSTPTAEGSTFQILTQPFYFICSSVTFCLLLEIASAIFWIRHFFLLSTGNCFELRKTKLDKFQEGNEQF